MNASNSSTTSENAGQASWLWYPIPWKWESLKKLVSTRVGTLTDGAYLGFTGESILMKRCDKDERVIQITEKHPTRGKIIAYNPGAKKISRFLPLYPEGDSLAVKKWEGYEKLGHVEADNGNLIREVEYEEIFRYLGDQDVVKMLSLMRVASLATAQVFGVSAETVFNIPKTAYQVTKEWVKSGLFIVNNTHNPSENSPFFGDWWTFRRRRRATV